MPHFLNNLPDYPLNLLRDDFFVAAKHECLLLEAEPGAGKSTVAPLWVLSKLSAEKSVWVIQPRVLAAQALAQRLADLVGDKLGETVGYQVPYDKVSSDTTRLLLMTPGVLLQHLLNNPTLEHVACVILDEIHERSVNQDTAWAWLQEVQILRDDLQLILMSATPDPALQQQIKNRLFAAGRCFPVTTSYCPAKTNTQYLEKIEDHVMRALIAQAQWQNETVLIFLPGWNEIEKAAQLIRTRFPDQLVVRLHSRVPALEQKNALNPEYGPRIILSTNIAETSLTIPDVTLVIDSGLVRRADYEQRTGINRLRMSRISQASANQRRGRAGRVQAGHCVRLWSQDQPLAPADLPEIRATDYVPLALRLAHWGSAVYELPWLEAPNRLALALAQQQLQKMQFLDEQQKITEKGRLVSALGVHPRIAAILLHEKNTLSEATLLLALALHFEFLAAEDINRLLESALNELQRNQQWKQQKKRWLSTLNCKLDTNKELNCKAIAAAYSDRIGFLQDSGVYRLNSGISVAAQENLFSQWAVFPIIIPKPKSHAGIGVELTLTKDEQRALSLAQTQLIFSRGSWHEKTTWIMGGIVVDEKNEPIIPNDIAAKLSAHIDNIMNDEGINALTWSHSAKRLLQRARLIIQHQLLALPEISDEGLVANASVWLTPFLNAETALDKLPLDAALAFYIGHENCQKIDQLLPEKFILPSGRHITVEFSEAGEPEIFAKLQEFFGCEQLQFANGKIPLRIHLLSPNGSPLAITTNLETFWRQAYPEVRKEMRGRYPRHPWPENPLEHEATALTKRKLAVQNDDKRAS